MWKIIMLRTKRKYMILIIVNKRNSDTGDEQQVCFRIWSSDFFFFFPEAITNKLNLEVELNWEPLQVYNGDFMGVHC